LKLFADGREERQFLLLEGSIEVVFVTYSFRARQIKRKRSRLEFRTRHNIGQNFQPGNSDEKFCGEVAAELISYVRRLKTSDNSKSYDSTSVDAQI